MVKRDSNGHVIQPDILIEWEELRQTQAGYLYRAQVPGGWLVKEVQDVGIVLNGSLDHGYSWQSTLVFIPDPTHSWS